MFTTNRTRKTLAAELVMGTKIVSFAACVLVAPASADTINLNATVRDFNDTHPDFENARGDDRGFVDSTIGEDRKPIYIGGDGTLTTHGEDAFNQWYNNVDGVNISTPFNIALDNNMKGEGGVYSFSDDTFFPIDDQLFGNQGRSHNYHFTLELHTEFTYVPGLEFNFTGDDDLFVFINDELVIDLGGVHPPQPASVALDTLGLVEGETYAFDLFFAERHTTCSNFMIETSIVFVPCEGDVDLDGHVAFSDLLAVLAAWGPYDPCPPFIPEDIDEDCVVGFSDILAVLGAWGQCP